VSKASIHGGKQEIEKGEIDIREYRDLLVVSVKESVFFVPDWPTMLPGGQDILQRLAPGRRPGHHADTCTIKPASHPRSIRTAALSKPIGRVLSRARS